MHKVIQLRIFTRLQSILYKKLHTYIVSLQVRHVLLLAVTISVDILFILYIYSSQTHCKRLYLITQLFHSLLRNETTELLYCCTMCSAKTGSIEWHTKYHCLLWNHMWRAERVQKMSTVIASSVVYMIHPGERKFIHPCAVNISTLTKYNWTNYRYFLGW